MGLIPKLAVEGGQKRAESRAKFRESEVSKAFLESSARHAQRPAGFLSVDYVTVYREHHTTGSWSRSKGMCFHRETFSLLQERAFSGCSLSIGLEHPSL